MSENIILVEVGAAPLPNTTPVVPVYRNWFPVPNTAAPIASPAVTIAPVAHGLLLTWPSSIADAEYRVEGADDNSGSPGTWSLIGTTSDLRYTVTTASLATRWYRVTATLRGRVSAPSAAVQGTPISPAQLQQFNDLANDNLLTPDEKPRVIQDRDTINGERTGLEAQATSYGITTEKATYSNAVDALAAYLATLTSPVLWSDLTGNTTIVGTTLRQKFIDVAVARQALVNKFAAEAKRLLDDIVSDNLISRAEKTGEIVRWQEAVNALSSDQSKADTAQVSRSAYDAAYTALESYINSLSPALTNTSADTPVDAETYRLRWSNYLTQRALLLNAIAEMARSLASEANSRGFDSNIVPSAGFGPSDGWRTMWGQATATWNLNNAPNGLAPMGVNVYWTSLSGAINGIIQGRHSQEFPIEGGERYCWQARAWAQRANAAIGIVVFDKDGNIVAGSEMPSPGRASEPANADAWKRINGYELFFGFFDAPSSAVSANIYYRPIGNGGVNPYCGFFNPMVSRASATQTIPPPFSVNDQSPAINAALSEIGAIVSDSVIARSEKRGEILRWTKAQNERQELINRASTAGVSSTNYSTAYTALSNYIGTLSNFNDVAQDTPVNGVTYRGNWAAYYTEFEALVRAIEAKMGSTATWSGVSGSGKPQDNATVGAPAGTEVNGVAVEALTQDVETAKIDAGNALIGVGIVASDSQLTGAEKRGERIRWGEVYNQLDDLRSKAANAGISATAMNTAATALNDYLLSLSPAFHTSQATTPIVAETYRQKWTDFYDQRTLLLNAIADKARTTSNWSGVTGAGKPADNATVGAAWATNVTGRPTELTDGRVASGFNSDGTLVSGKNNLDRIADSTTYRRAGAGYVDTSGRISNLWDEETGIIRSAGFVGGGAARARNGLQSDGKLVAGKNDASLIDESGNRKWAGQSGADVTSSFLPYEIPDAGFETCTQVGNTFYDRSGKPIFHYEGSLNWYIDTGGYAGTKQLTQMGGAGSGVFLIDGPFPCTAGDRLQVVSKVRQRWSSGTVKLFVQYLNSDGGWVGETVDSYWRNPGAHNVWGELECYGTAPNNATQHRIGIAISGRDDVGAWDFDALEVRKLPKSLDVVPDGTAFGRTSQTDLVNNRVGLRVPGSNQKIGDQRNLPPVLTAAYGSIRSATALSATSAGVVTVNAHSVRYGSVSVPYNAVSNAVSGLTQNQTYAIYCFDPDYTGATKTWYATTDTDWLMQQGDGIRVAGHIWIPTTGTESGGGGGGTLYYGSTQPPSTTPGTPIEP